MKIVKIKLAYTTVRFASLRNAAARGAKIGAALGFYEIMQAFRKLVGSCRMQLAYTTVGFALAKSAPG